MKLGNLEINTSRRPMTSPRSEFGREQVQTYHPYGHGRPGFPPRLGRVERPKIDLLQQEFPCVLNALIIIHRCTSIELQRVLIKEDVREFFMNSISRLNPIASWRIYTQTRRK